MSPEEMKSETYQVALVHEVSGAEATFQGISSAEAGATRGPGVMPWKVLAERGKGDKNKAREDVPWRGESPRQLISTALP